MRYLRQYTKKDCGPVACINILKYVGKQATYQDLYRIRREVGHCPYWGVVPYGVGYWLNKNKIDYQYVTFPKMSTIKSALCNDYIILIRASWVIDKKYYAHYALLIDYTYKDPEPYKAINYRGEETYSGVSYKELKQDMSLKIRNNPYKDEPNMWIIKGVKS